METTSIANLYAPNEGLTADFNPKWIRQLDAVVLLFITTIGVIGNTMVGLSFFLSNQLRTKTNILVVNLATADFFTCTTLPIVAWSLLVESDEEANAVYAPCAIVLVLTQSFIGCSIITLALIALNRWMLISRRRELYDKVCQYRVILGALVISWLLPLIVTITPILAGVGVIGYDKWSHNCALLADHPYSYLYKVILLSSLMPAPMTIIMFCYWSIFKHVKSHNMKIQQSTTEASRTISDTLSGFRYVIVSKVISKKCFVLFCYQSCFQNIANDRSLLR